MYLSVSYLLSLHLFHLDPFLSIYLNWHYFTLHCTFYVLFTETSCFLCCFKCVNRRLYLSLYISLLKNYIILYFYLDFKWLFSVIVQDTSHVTRWTSWTRLGDTEDRTIRCNTYLIRVKELQNRENGSGGIFKMIMTMKFSVLKILVSIFKYSYLIT